MLGDSGLGKDGLCGQEEEWNQRCVGYYVIVMYSPTMSCKLYNTSTCIPGIVS